MPTEISAELAQIIMDVSNIAGVCLGIWAALWGFRKMRNELRYGGPPPMSRKEQADELRFLRSHGWTNKEIRQGGKGLEP